MTSQNKRGIVISENYCISEKVTAALSTTPAARKRT